MSTRSRAQENGVSTKRLRRMAAVRLERIRTAVLVIRQGWDQLDDASTDELFDRFGRHVDELESDLAGVLEYHDLPVGEELS